MACAYQGNPVIKLPAGQDYYERPFGKIHQSCLGRFGGKFVNAIEEQVSEGLACLKKLSTTSTNNNYQRLKKLYDSKKQVYFCDEQTYDWKELYAHASANSRWDLKDQKVFHPYISINPDKVLLGTEFNGKIVTYDSVKALIFHESIHNIGYLHGSTIEYAFACEECCFQSMPM
jgi:hypothetical protein